METLKERIKRAYEADPEILCDKEKMGEVFGNNPAYLKDVFGIDKSDLIRLERKGLAVKARYVIEKTGEHRARWIIFKEVLR